jgi:hypothetical protein
MRPFELAGADVCAVVVGAADGFVGTPGGPATYAGREVGVALAEALADGTAEPCGGALVPGEIVGTAGSPFDTRAVSSTFVVGEDASGVFGLEPAAVLDRAAAK